MVALAGSVASEGEARYMANAVGMARRISAGREPVVALDLMGRILVVRTRGDRIVVPAPVDYVVWTEPVRAFAQRKNLKGARRDILVTGLASARAREGLQATRWALVDHSKR